MIQTGLMLKFKIDFAKMFKLYSTTERTFCIQIGSEWGNNLSILPWHFFLEMYTVFSLRPPLGQDFVCSVPEAATFRTAFVDWLLWLLVLSGGSLIMDLYRAQKNMFSRIHELRSDD